MLFTVDIKHEKIFCVLFIEMEGMQLGGVGSGQKDADGV